MLMGRTQVLRVASERAGPACAKPKRLHFGEGRGPRSNALDVPGQCCGVCRPTSFFGRIGIMLARLDDLPAAPARGGATSPLTLNGISGPICGAKEFQVAGGRVGAMLFRAGEPDWRSACGNCGNWRFPPVAGNIGGPRLATRVSATSVSPRRLGPEMRRHHRRRFVVGLKPLLQEA